jgi:hypothetical protein
MVETNNTKKQKEPIMAKETDIKRLEARIVELENTLKALLVTKEPVDLSANDIKSYLKVRDALACDIFKCSPTKRCSPGFYGQIEVFSKCSCIPTVCWVSRACAACFSGDVGGGGERFTDLGS